MKTFLSNINISPIKSLYPNEDIQFYLYAEFQQQLLFLASETSKITQDVICIFIDFDEFFSIESSVIHYNEERIFQKFDELRSQIIQCIEINKNQLFIINNFVCTPNLIGNKIDVHALHGLRSIIAKMNAEIIEIANSYRNLMILDWASIVANEGYKNVYDSRFWYLGHIKYNISAHSLLAKEINSIIKIKNTSSKKLLVLDLDNTLWGGVIGEDGIDGIQLSEETTGKPFRDFQKCIKSLLDLGVVLAINSKNNEKDVEQAFHEHSMMILTYDDFIVKKINWQNKADNLLEICQELQLGLDSVVFIDDNPVERELVKSTLSEVEVPDFPTNIFELKDWFVSEIYNPFFQKIYLSEEDTSKQNQYKSLIARNKDSQVMNYKDFLTSLQIQTTFYVDNPQCIQRIAQLTQKTNQFNVTTRRYSEIDIQQFVENKDYTVFCIEYSDKYGKEGIIGSAICKLSENNIYIDTFLLSCRVLGRNIEFIFMQEILNYFVSKIPTIRTVIGEYIETTKNKQTKDFYSKLQMIEKSPNIFEQDITIVLENLKLKL